MIPGPVWVQSRSRSAPAFARKHRRARELTGPFAPLADPRADGSDLGRRVARSATLRPARPFEYDLVRLV
jgi:hypothetical protein